jgi:hypothetical protein
MKEFVSTNNGGGGDWGSFDGGKVKNIKTIQWTN